MAGSGWRNWQNFITIGTRAQQPINRPVPIGALYSVMDEGWIIERWDGRRWQQFGVSPTFIYTGRFVAQTAAVPSVVSCSVGPVDCTFHVSANVNVTVMPTHQLIVTCAYIDETNIARTLVLAFVHGNGAQLLNEVGKNTGLGAYTGLIYHIRCKANTTINIATSGTFATVMYNVEGEIRRIN